MDLNLRGKTALVTGSSRGIGKAIASSLLEEGSNVVLNGLHEKTLKATSKSVGHNCRYFVGDVTKTADCKKMIEYTIKQFKTIDILVCNVGDGRSPSNGKETVSDWIKMLNVNLLGSVNVIKASESYLAMSKGSIVCISSIAGLASIGAPIAYAASKSALNSFVRNSAGPLAKKNIRINAVAPGNIMFKGSVWERKLKENPHKVRKMLKENVALGKFGTPTDVSNVVKFLLSWQASFITGSIFVVDGGQIL